MEKLNKSVILDTDVLVSWLSQEKESVSGKEIWRSALKIISLIEKGKISGFISVTSLLELRFVLRRKKRQSENLITSLIENCFKIFEIVIPDEIELLRANNLQIKYPLDPFDAILISLALSKQIIIIAWDKQLLKITNQLSEANNPEEFLSSLDPKLL